MFESICDKRCHAQRILHNISSMTEDTRGSCWTVRDHAKINKIVQRYQLIVFILNKWGNIGNKIGGYQIYDFDHCFDMNYMSYRRFQMSILISDIQALLSKIVCLGKNSDNCKKTRFLNSNIESHIQNSAVRSSQGFV